MTLVRLEVSSALARQATEPSRSASRRAATELYPGLTDGTNAVSVGAGGGSSDEFDNVAYAGPALVGDPATVLALVSNDSNWTGSNSTLGLRTRFDGLTIDVQSSEPIPEPCSLLLMLGASTVACCRRRFRVRDRRKA